MRWAITLWAVTMPLSLGAAADTETRVANWNPVPSAWKGAKIADGTATMTADHWSYLMAPSNITDAEVAATVTIREPGRLKSFFGQSWSVWPDKTYSDGGWDAGFLLRGGDGSGYRVQASAALGEICLEAVS